MSKYGNNKCIWNGETFDSQRELERWVILQYDAKTGRIRNLRRQVRFELTPPIEIGGTKLRKSEYVADFVYEALSGNEWYTVIEDTKGFRTAEYKLKRKMMAYRYGILVRET